jgi:cell division protein FtsB
MFKEESYYHYVIEELKKRVEELEKQIADMRGNT